ncbi:phosphate ABC transporter substrate-binding protein PstS [Microbacterium sp. CJ88]|uniref:phosphate ABC transporter substrate-binding protein PstS n=1 Tax=Microbacterium sp. CJ88 TaxID=3445672 RepID=UPI003F656716
MLRRSLVRGGALALAAALMLTALPVAASAADSYVPISGTGSTWTQSALDQWRRDVAADSGMTVNYSGVGSTVGLQDFVDQTVAFAVSDRPFRAQPENGQPAETPRTTYEYVPAVGGGLSLMYNLHSGGSQITDLRLSGDVVARIFTGVITNWADPAIAADNPGKALPNKAITPVVRSDYSATSLRFTQWMSSEHPSIWTAGASEAFPLLAPSFTAQSGSLGVAGYVSQSYGEGAITYVEDSYALRAGFPAVKLRNAADFYVAPTADSVAIALLGAASVAATGEIDHQGVWRNADPRAYPLSSAAYLVVPTQATQVVGTDQGRSLAAFAAHALCAGQQRAGSLGYAPLPVNLVQDAAPRLGRIPGGTALDLSSCANPTFVAGDTPMSNVLLRTVPMPPASDRADAPADPHASLGLSAAITASDLFELRASTTSTIDLGATRRGGVTAPVMFGGITVVDDRVDLRGWDLHVDVSDFTSSTSVPVPSSALGFAPTSSALPPGLSLGAPQTAGSASYSATAARSEPGASTGPAGVALGAALTFRPPADAALGDYRSTLTLTLVSR